MALGYPHPDYLTPYLSHEQVKEWKTYHKIEPFGADVLMLQMAVVASAIINHDPHRSRRAPRVTPEDLLVGYKKPQMEPTKENYMTLFGAGVTKLKPGEKPSYRGRSRRKSRMLKTQSKQRGQRLK